MGLLASILTALFGPEGGGSDRRRVREQWRSHRRASLWQQLQNEAGARPGAAWVLTRFGGIWMSPIELELYEAMVRAGLSPVPQCCIAGYYVDFAFPEVWVAVEADGSAFHDGPNRARDQRRDWVLRREGWTVLRFHGTTIHQKAGSCAYVVRREVESRGWRVRERASMSTDSPTP